MISLEAFRDHCRERAAFQVGKPRYSCADQTAFGSPKPRDHANCRGNDCGCRCHAPTPEQRALFTQLADEIDDYLNATCEAAIDAEQEGLFR